MVSTRPKNEEKKMGVVNDFGATFFYCFLADPKKIPKIICKLLSKEGRKEQMAELVAVALSNPTVRKGIVIGWAVVVVIALAIMLRCNWNRSLSAKLWRALVCIIIPVPYIFQALLRKYILQRGTYCVSQQEE